MCRKASPEPSPISAKPNPFCGLNHLTTASISGPEEGRGVGDRDSGIGGNGSRPGLVNSSPPKSRRRESRKSRPRLIREARVKGLLRFNSETDQVFQLFARVQLAIVCD